MKTKIFILLASVALLACTKSPQPSAQGEALLNILNADNHSLVVFNQDSISFHNGRGVSDLLDLISNEPGRLHGAIVADKMIGKAAAALMVAGQVSEVHTNLMCTPAINVFRQADIPVFFREEVPQILNRDRSGQCPIDGLLNETDDVEQCVQILKNKFQQ